MCDGGNKYGFISTRCVLIFLPDTSVIVVFGHDVDPVMMRSSLPNATTIVLSLFLCVEMMEPHIPKIVIVEALPVSLCTLSPLEFGSPPEHI